MNNAYTTFYKNELVLSQGKKDANLFKIGEFFLLYQDSVNMSTKDWSEVVRSSMNL